MSSHTWDTIGNVLSVGGILITAAGFVVEHRGRQLGELEPNLVKAWRRTRAWIFKVLRIHRDATVFVGTANATVGVSMEARGSAWSPVDADKDDLATQVRKTLENVERLRTRGNSDYDDLRKRQSEGQKHFNERLADIERKHLDEAQNDRVLSTLSMRWQLRGIAMALVGAALSAGASLAG